MKKCLSVLVCALVLLAGCRSAPGDGPAPSSAPAETPEAARALTRDEVERVNKAFASMEDGGSGTRATPVSGFFTSRYEAPEDLDFAEFLRYFPDDGTLSAENRAESDALAALPGYPWGDSVGDMPIHRIPRASVDEALSRYAGITAAELADTSGVPYLEEYDAWYTFTSDFGPGTFHCVGGEAEGDTARLWAAPGEDGSRAELTLRKEGENWFIRSFLDSGPDPGRTLKGFLSEWKAEEIGSVSWGGPNEDPAAEVLAPMVRASMERTVDHNALTLNGSDTDVVWSLDVYLGDKDAGGWSGEDAVHLWAGLEENLVEIFAGENLPRGRLFVEDEALYQFLRTQNDRPDHIDRAAYASYRDTVDAYFDARRTEAWDGGFSSWELTDFFPVAENEGRNAQVYAMAAAYRADPPEKAARMLAGGMYVDSTLRAHGLDWRPVYLLAVDGRAVHVTGDGRAEDVDLTDDGKAEIVAYLPGNARGVVIYDLSGGKLTGLDVNQTLGCRGSDYAGNIGNIRGEYSNCIEAFFGEDGAGVSKIYRYTAARTLEYVCGLDEALRR